MTELEIIKEKSKIPELKEEIVVRYEKIEDVLKLTFDVSVEYPLLDFFYILKNFFKIIDWDEIKEFDFSTTKSEIFILKPLNSSVNNFDYIFYQLIGFKKA